MARWIILLLIMQGCATVNHVKHGEGIVPAGKIAEGRKLIVDTKYKDAQDYFDTIQNQYANSIEARLWFVNTLLIQGKNQEAENTIKSLITSFPHEYKLYAKLAEVYERSLKVDAGKAYFSELLLKKPSEPYIYGPYTRLLRASGEHDKAILFCEKMLELKPNDFELLKSLAISYFFKGKLRLSEMLARQALHIHEHDAELLNVRGLIEAQEKDYSRAINYLSQAFEIDDTEPNVSFNIGSIALDFGDYKRALKAFNAFVSLRPENHNGVYGRGFAATNQNKAGNT